MGAVILGVIILAAAGGSTEESKDDEPAKTEQTSSDDSKDKKESDASGGEEESKEEQEDCDFKATNDCTPHVDSDGKVRVDALIWRLVSAETAPTIGDMEYGLGEKANGVFVVVKLKVNSTKTESITLSDDVIGLEAKGNTYKPDTDGTVAAIGAGEEPFFLEEVGPGTTLTGTVVFDVPRKVLGQKPELSFGELGFGSTKAYIALPPLT